MMLWWLNFFQFEYLNQMGAVCDNAPLTNFNELEGVEATKVTSYELCEWPSDALFQSKIEHLKSKEGMHALT